MRPDPPARYRVGQQEEAVEQQEHCEHDRCQAHRRLNRWCQGAASSSIERVVEPIRRVGSTSLTQQVVRAAQRRMHHIPKSQTEVHHDEDANQIDQQEREELTRPIIEVANPVHTLVQASEPAKRR
jgi:hypothetical protein